MPCAARYALATAVTVVAGGVPAASAPVAACNQHSISSAAASAANWYTYAAHVV